MRTSLIETAQIEQFVRQEGDPAERLLIEARLQIDSELAEKVTAQHQTYAAIHAYGRAKIKAEIRRIDAQMFREPEHRTFRQKITSIFSHR